MHRVLSSAGGESLNRVWATREAEASGKALLPSCGESARHASRSISRPHKSPFVKRTMGRMTRQGERKVVRRGNEETFLFWYLRRSWRDGRMNWGTRVCFRPNPTACGKHHSQIALHGWKIEKKHKVRNPGSKKLHSLTTDWGQKQQKGLLGFQFDSHLVLNVSTCCFSVADEACNRK